MTGAKRWRAYLSGLEGHDGRRMEESPGTVNHPAPSTASCSRAAVAEAGSRGRAARVWFGG